MKRRLKGIVAAVLGGLALVIGGLAIYGMTLPREHEVSLTVQVAPPPAEVFAILVDVEQYTCWRPGVSSVEVRSHDPLRFVTDGEDDTLPFAVVESVPDRKLVVKIDDESMPWGGAWTYELAPAEAGTTVTITERGWVDNVVLRGMVNLLMDPSASIRQFQADLLAHKRC
ncbi:MAG: SRPBCC domain-containing protein [Myxococcota bacterium]